MKQVKTQAEDIPMVLIANKCDLAESAAVTRDEATAAGAAFGMTVFFTSAKTGESVEAAFTHLGKIAAEKAQAAKANKPPAVGVVNLKDTPASAAAAAGGGCAC
jgi:50S ribosomal subunit-associated GTPase HflX